MTCQRDNTWVVPCYKCGAKEGQACTSKSGRRATYIHAVRWEHYRDVLAVGEDYHDPAEIEPDPAERPEL